MLSDARWAELEPLVEACRPKGKTPPQELRRTLSAILWRHYNGARWRAIPQELGPWWQAAQLFIRWAHAGVWERLLDLARERGVRLGGVRLGGVRLGGVRLGGVRLGGVRLGMVFLDGTNIRAHQKAAGARRKGALAPSEIIVRRLADHVAGMAPRPA